MAEITRIAGEPYKAEFVGTDDAGNDYAFAYAEVHPPFDLSRACGLVEAAKVGPVEIQDYATTIGSTVLRFGISVSTDTSHSEAIEYAELTLTNIITGLNGIEAGTFLIELKEG